MWRYVDLDVPQRSYHAANLHFTYWPFDWIRPLPSPWLTVLFLAISVAGAAVAIGAYHRIASAFICAGMTYIFLLDSAFYLNHWYLACVLAGLFACLPADVMWSFDARLDPSRRRLTVPAWTIWLLRVQVGVVYFYAGLCKLNSDWLAGRPLAMWLTHSTGFPVIGRWFETRGVPNAMAIASAVFDIVLVAALLWTPTRRWAYPVAMVFHLMNSHLFRIGMFPWVMMLLTLVFFPADMPRRVLSDLRGGHRRVPTVAGAAIMGTLAATVPRVVSPPSIVIGVVVGAVAAYHLFGGDARESFASSEERPTRRRTRVLVAAWVALQLLLPLRPYVIGGGEPGWTEEGQMFSWRLLVRSKTGNVIFHVYDPSTGRTEHVDPAEYLVAGQLGNLSEQPEMIVQFAQWLESERRTPGGPDLVVTASTSVSLNGADPLPLVDPEVDLTRIRRPWMPPADWILPRP